MTNKNTAENQSDIGRAELSGINAVERMVESLVNADASNERIKEAIQTIQDRATNRAHVLLSQRKAKAMEALIKEKQSE